MSAVTLLELEQQARGLGFAACGVASLEPSRRADALDRWLAAGFAGTMRYLNRQATKRKQPASIVPGAKVAVVVLENYLPSKRPETNSPSVRIAKYARGTDYHLAFRERLERLAERLRQLGATIAQSWVDAGPVPERELAERAGLGWIGKNTMLIRPGAGSFFFIGTVFTDLELRASRSLELDRCGSCTRCLDACPTGALVEPRVLDATRCISYHTIESRQPIPARVVAQMNGWAFGCDICNDVCPWNLRFGEEPGGGDYQDRGSIAREDRSFFERMTEAEFAERFGDTPLERPGLDGMRRNWAAAFQSLEEAS